jgi:hypothetical protein
MSNLWKQATVCLAMILLYSSLSLAQERGQYVPGFAGLNSGVQAPQGYTYANYFIWYPTDRLNNSDGDEVPLNFDLDLVVDFNILAYTSKAKLFGGTYGVAIAIPILNQSVGLAVLGTDIGSFGMGDIYVEPINLGWKRPGIWDVKAAYGFVAPTGKFDEQGTDTTTTDYWGHEFTFAATRTFGGPKLYQVSISTNWEFHHEKRHEDIRVGNNMTLEYGIGKTFIKSQGTRLIQFGAIGYAEFQLSDDSGSDVGPLNRGNEDYVFGLGGEFGLILPQNKFNFFVRVIPEFGAHSRTQGFTFVFGAGKSF